MVLDGLLPVADALLDVPFADDEFVTERERRESERGGYLSLLGHVALISYHGVEVMSVSKVRYTT